MRKTFTYKGKRYSVERKTHDELILAVADKKRELESAEKDKANPPFNAFANQWLKTYKKPYIKDVSMYVSAINTISAELGYKRMRDIIPSDLQKIVAQVFESGCSKSKLDKLFIAMRQIFRQALADRIIDHDPTIALIKPTIKEGKRRALTYCEEYVIRECCKTSKYGNWILTILMLGLRPGEASTIQKKDIVDGYIHIKGTKTSKADRYIPVPDSLVFDLKGLKADDYIFTTQQNTQLKRQSMERWWNFFKRDLDLFMNAPTYRNQIVESYITEDITLYSLRHTYGTRASQSGIPIDVLADLMGHEKIETTRKYYISDNRESKDRQIEKLNNMWAGVRGRTSDKI